MIWFLKRCHRDEAGSSLVLALVFLSILGVGSAALISFGATSERATVNAVRAIQKLGDPKAKPPATLAATAPTMM